MEGTIGEIRLFAGSVDGIYGPPRGWLVCDGAVLPIGSYQPLFSVLGAVYGGDGEATFALPDLRGRVVVGIGSAPGRPAYAIGQQAGTEQIPTQPVEVSTGGSPSFAVSSVAAAGDSNIQPGLALHYLICAAGQFPFPNPGDR